VHPSGVLAWKLALNRLFDVAEGLPDMPIAASLRPQIQSRHIGMSACRHVGMGEHDASSTLLLGLNISATPSIPYGHGPVGGFLLSCLFRP